jgi:biotin carboxyl carrier protein
MQGSVWKVPHMPGDRVEAGDTVIILEAMKMENEIAAPISGTITSVLISEGQTVDSGDILLTIE